MRKKKLNKVLGVILAIALPITIIGIVSLAIMLPSQAIFEENGWYNRMGHMWSEGSWWSNRRMGNGHMNNNSNNNTNNNNNNGHMNNRPGMNGNHNMNNNNNYGTGNSQLNSNRYNIDGLNSISIDDVVDNVEVVYSDNGNSYVTYDGNRNVEAQVYNGKLKIVDRDYNKRSLNLNEYFKDAKTITLYLASNNINLEIDAAVSNIYVDSVNLNQLDLELGVGELFIKNSNIQRDLDIDAGTGNVKLEKLKASKVEIDLGLGNVTVNDSEITYLDIDEGLGQVNITDSRIQTLETEGGLSRINIQNSKIDSHRKN